MGFVHFGFVSVRLLFACVRLLLHSSYQRFIINSVSLSGWSAKISHIYSKCLRFLSFWWFRYDLHKPVSLNETSVQSTLLDHMCENESEKTFKFAIVNIVTIKTPRAPLSLFSLTVNHSTSLNSCCCCESSGPL